MATFTLLLWIFIAPLIAIRLTAVQIVIWLTLGPYLFLPEATSINLPGLPDVDKTAAITLGLLLSYVCHYKKFAAVEHPKPRVWGVKLAVLIFFILMLVGTALTIRTNPEPLFYGPIMLPALRPWDGVSMLSAVVFMIVPFFFALRYLWSPAAHKELLHAFVVMGLIYSVLMLIEIRLSPQLHTWLYGYFQHSFIQHIRGGFRPIVFLQHGIWVGFFIFSTVLAALAMWKTSKDRKWLFAALWLFVILAISKNMGATVICLLCGLIYLCAGRWLQTLCAAAIALIVLVYPAIRQSNIIPVSQIADLAATVSADRAQSLQYRLHNEDQLLARATLKPLAGWGGYNRESIYSEWGQILSVPDGLWIIIIGTRGWLGYIALFGILTVSTFFLWLSQTRTKPPPETMALAMIIMGNMIYVVPNATLTAIGWLVFGGLTGYVRYVTTDAQATQAPEAAAPNHRMHPVYTRFPKK